jgi:hypothetical protein
MAKSKPSDRLRLNIWWNKPDTAATHPAVIMETMNALGMWASHKRTGSSRIIDIRKGDLPVAEKIAAANGWRIEVQNPQPAAFAAKETK